MQRKLMAGGAWHRLATSVPVSHPHDPAERDADRVADAVMHGEAAAPAPVASSVQRMCAECEEEQRGVQRASDGAGAAAPAPAQPLAEGGQPLPRGLRDFFEPRLGADLGQVRVHADSRAAQSAVDFRARAYTFGSHVVFGAGQYRPASPAGQRLLAHELAHVVQQSAEVRPMVQRQIPIPIFDELDICVDVPGAGRVCGSDARKACEKVSAIPGCTAVCKRLGCKKPDQPKTTCPPGFRAAGSKAFEGQCCRGEIDNAKDCCPPERIALFD
ncbi:MAG TPA: DUF4157 domain-containing protein, partial [Burkholderiales bacterium]|nr:DUF4157 domain-containing protein [Burkholderiales bacterium]